MDSLRNILATQRPDVIAAGVPIDAWWKKNGAKELRNVLAKYGRQDVLNVAGNDDNWLLQWYLKNGTREYSNIWSSPARPQGMAQQYAAAGGEAPKAATFEETLPYETAWGQIAGGAKSSAEQLVNPELARQYEAAKQNYMNQLASQGGGRFGAGFGGLGSIWAENERNRKAQVQDWVNMYQQGFRNLFYEPSEEAWTQAMTQGRTPSYTAPQTWEEYTGQYGSSMDTPYTSSGGINPSIKTGTASLF